MSETAAHTFATINCTRLDFRCQKHKCISLSDIFNYLWLHKFRNQLNP